jgi:hypothetical protein
VRRAFKFGAYLTGPQEGRAVRLLADHCDLYNAALIERREAWRTRRESIGYRAQAAQLTEIRRADPDGQGRHSCTAQQQTLRRLDAIFATFCGRVKAAEAGSLRSCRLQAAEQSLTRIAVALFSHCRVTVTDDSGISRHLGNWRPRPVRRCGPRRPRTRGPSRVPAARLRRSRGSYGRSS